MSLTGQVYPSVQFNEEYVKSKSKDTTGAITTNNKAAVNESGDLNAKITKQGELVRDLKAKKASKEEVTKEVGVLLALKAEFKTLTGERDLKAKKASKVRILCTFKNRKVKK